MNGVLWLGGRCGKDAPFTAYRLAPWLLPGTKTPDAEMLTLSFVFVAFGGSPIRDFFQISSDADTESVSAFRLPKLRLDAPSSSDSTVRSITCVPDDPLVGICSARDGDNSRLTSPSSSSSESKTTTSPDLWLFSWFEAPRIWPEGL